MTPLAYSGYRFPRDIIQRAIWMYLRFTLSFRDVEELLAERGITVAYESIRRWSFPSARSSHVGCGRDVRSRTADGTWTRCLSASAASRCTCGGRRCHGNGFYLSIAGEWHNAPLALSTT